MVKQFASAVALSVAFSACSGAPGEPPAPAPLDPTGVYTVDIEAQGQQIGGTLTISGTEDAYAGSIDTDMGAATIADVVVMGEEMTFSIPEVSLDFTVVFDGETFTGEFGGGMGSGTIVGVKTSP